MFNRIKDLLFFKLMFTMIENSSLRRKSIIHLEKSREHLNQSIELQRKIVEYEAALNKIVYVAEKGGNWLDPAKEVLVKYNALKVGDVK
jgi:hypothetical protein